MYKDDDQPDHRFFKDLQVEFLIHELKDPTSVIEAGARGLLERRDKFGDLTPRQEKTLKRILRAANKSRDMLYSLLEVGGAEAGREACNYFRLNNLVFDCLVESLEALDEDLFEQVNGFDSREDALPFLDSRGIKIDYSPETKDLFICQDEEKFRRIIGNLVKNAFHFRKNLIIIKTSVQNGSVLVAVSDDGPGVPPDKLEDIFRQYVQGAEKAASSRKGHGLGLAGARIIARSLGGDVAVDNRPQGGASFIFSAPLIIDKKE